MSNEVSEIEARIAAVRRAVVEIDSYLSVHSDGSPMLSNKGAIKGVREHWPIIREAVLHPVAQYPKDREQIAALLFVTRYPHKTWTAAPLTETSIAYRQADALLGLPHTPIDPAPYTTTGRPVMCEECGVYPADLPSKICPGCHAYRDHQS